MKITKRHIADQLVTAFEGGSNYWLDRSKVTDQNQRVLLAWDWSENPDLIHQVQITCENYNDDDSKNKTFTLTMDELLQKAQELQNSNPKLYNEIINEQGDANTADLFLQLTFLNEEVFC